jgi:hypothetical protein
MKDYAPIPPVGAYQEHYWRGSPSRKEMQEVLDEYTKHAQSLEAAIRNLDIVVAFLMERSGASPEEVKAFAEKKLAEAQAAQQAAEQPKVSLEEN